MIRLRQIKVLVNKDNLKEEIAKKIKINISDILNIKIIKKSLDARFKPKLYYVYEVDIQVNREDIILKKYLTYHLKMFQLHLRQIAHYIQYLKNCPSKND